MFLSFVSNQLLDVLSACVCACHGTLFGVVTYLFSLALRSPTAHVSLSDRLSGGEALEQQALAGCWYSDVQHSSRYEGHPEW